MRIAPLVLIVAAIHTSASAQLSATMEERAKAGPVREGRYRAWFESPGGELPFGLEMAQSDGSTLTATIINGPERLEATAAFAKKGLFVLRLDHYDSVIRARILDRGTRLEGRWVKTTGPDKRASLSFHATLGDSPRFPAPAKAGEPASTGADDLPQRWRVRFESSDDPAVGIFRLNEDRTVDGTFMTTTGDYRYLAGSYINGRLRLSCFDGGHAFLFDAQRQDDGSLAGDFYSRDSWHETWTAIADPEADLPDAFAQTTWTDKATLEELTFKDLEGRSRSVASCQPEGRPMVVEVFGSWCPNCNDAAEYMIELHEKYGSRGVSFLGIAFELTGDFDRDVKQLQRFIDKYDLQYEILLAGISNKAEATKRFPVLDRVRSYPTTIFIDANRKVRAVHTGFTGPATGEAYERMRSRFEGVIEEMIDAADSGE